MDWISVKDRLPEDTEWIIGYSDDVYFFKFKETTTKRAKIRKGQFESFDESFVDDNVTYWMPLPKPPKEGIEHVKKWEELVLNCGLNHMGKIDANFVEMVKGVSEDLLGREK
jgi:hypothetical protein